MFWPDVHVWLGLGKTSKRLREMPLIISTRYIHLFRGGSELRVGEWAEWKKVMVWDVCKKHSGLSNMTPVPTTVQAEAQLGQMSNIFNFQERACWPTSEYVPERKCNRFQHVLIFGIAIRDDGSPSANILGGDYLCNAQK